MACRIPIAALVLAGGKGTRMKSDLPKVMQHVLDQPMLYYILRAIGDSGIENSAVVTGYGGDIVRQYLSESAPSVVPIVQEEQLGTGHAVGISSEWWKKFDNVLVLPGDVPLLRAESLKKLVELHIEGGDDCTFITFEPDDPSGYGRVIDHEGVLSIVEERDAADTQIKIAEVNSGIYIFKTSMLEETIPLLSNSNAQGEYYLTDLVYMISSGKGQVRACHVDSPSDFAGINDPVQLARVTGIMRERILTRCMMNGVRVMDPASTFIGPSVKIGRDVLIEPFVQIWGCSSIGEGARIGSYSTVTNSFLDEEVHLISHVVINDSNIGKGASVGPFAFIREGTDLASGAFVGKFVEVKKSSIGSGTKVPHLSYIGDATIGSGTNIGAGTITCNFDGKDKHKTVIGSGSFVGSDTILVAPVNLEDDTYTAAGSVITHDVPSGALAVSRSRQRNIEGWTKRKGRSDKRRK